MESIVRCPPRFLAAQQAARAPTALGCLLALAGCASPPPAGPGPLVPPALSVEARHFAGTCLTGPQAPGDDPGGADAALATRISVHALDRLDEEVLEPASPRTRLLAASRGGVPVVPVSLVAAGVRAAPLESAADLVARIEAGELGRSAHLGSVEGVLPPGYTFSARLRAPPGRGPADAPPPLEFQLSRLASGSIEVAVVAHGAAPPAADDSLFAGAEPGQAVLQPARRWLLQRETLILVLCGKEAPCRSAVLVPSPPGAFGEVRAFVAILEVSAAGAGDGPGAAELAARYERCRQEALAGAAGPVGFDAAQSTDREMRAALETLAAPHLQRGALVHLADICGAAIAADLVLVADAATVAQLAAALQRKLAPGAVAPGPGQERPAPLTRPAVGWALERAALEVLQAQLAAQQLPVELQAVLTRHMGEVGRQASSLEAVVFGARSLEELAALIVNENYTFLEDVLPSSRVRALDWLTARGKAPRGYDPLLSAKERRLALERHAAEEAAARETPASSSPATGTPPTASQGTSP